MIWEEEGDGDDGLLSEVLAELQFGGGGTRDAIDFEFIPYTYRRARRFGLHRRVNRLDCLNLPVLLV